MRSFLLSLFALLMLLTPGSSQTTPPDRPGGGPNAATWLKIDQLLAKGQTASAAKLLEPLYQQARRRPEAAPEYVRTLLYKLRLLENKEEEADYKGIKLLEADLKTATFPARPVLHSLLAQLYARYYQQHRYQLYRRTAVAGPDTADASRADLRTWDVSRLGAAVVDHYRASTTDEPRRQQQLALASLGYLSRGADAKGRARRPTLFDLLAVRAVEGLSNDEFYITRPAQQFQLTDPALFGPAAGFVRLNLKAPAADSLNGQFHALRVLQQQLAFRLREAGNRVALVAAELQRLDFLAQHAPTLAGNVQVAALQRLATEYADLPVGTEFLARLAELYKPNDPVQAIAAARTAEKRFPKSYGAQRARRVREELEQPQVGFGADAVVLPNQPWRLSGGATNVRALHAWAYRLTLAEWEQYNDYQRRREVPFARRYARALAQAPAATWTIAVPPAKEPYRSQEITAAGPALPLGRYLLVVSNQATDPTRSRAGGATSYAVLAVSELSALTDYDEQARQTNVLLLHRQTGALLPDVRALPTYARYNQQTRQLTYRKGAALTPDAGAELHLPAAGNEARQQGGEYLDQVLLTRGADTLKLGGLGGYHPDYHDEGPGRATNQTFLYTDRAIYRPGQTVYFKAILTRSKEGQTQLRTNERATVQLLDVNGQQVQQLETMASEFGSLHGSFVLPVGLLNGQMRLQTEHGSVSFSVEDYKRPTFTVSFEPVAGQPALGQSITLHGTAVAYAGQPVDGATVQYRVVRRVLLPFFGYDGGYGGGYIGRGAPETEVAQGTTQTDAEGKFSVPFTAQAGEPAAGSRWQPGSVFEVTADVTDAAGETRTGQQSVLLGPQPLSLRLQVPALLDRQKLPPLRLLGLSGAGQPLAVRGILRLYTLAPKPSPAGVPENIPDAENQQELVPTLLRQLPFDTEQLALTDLAAALAALPTGRYELLAQASTADSAQTRSRFTLYDSQAKVIPYSTPDWFVNLQDSVRPGQAAAVLLGSRHAETRVLLEVEARGQLLRKEWLTLAANEQRRLRIPAEASAGNYQLYIHTTQVRDNRLYRHTATVQVAEPPTPLVLSVATFRDKLQPGQRETWRITIKQANGNPADAELLATLYDQSLDAFRPHAFTPLTLPGRYFAARFGWQGQFERTNSRVLFLGNLSPNPPEINYPELNTWGLFGNRYAYAVTVQGNTDNPADLKGLASAEMADATAAPRIMLRGVSSAKLGEAEAVGGGASGAAAQPDLSAVQARTDFRETAFWLPALRTNAQGETVLEFQMPEAVTRWQLLALAHDRQLNSGLLRRELVTQKKLQITANAPRFFREGDQLIFQAKLSNLTDAALAGTAQLFLLDARTQQPLEARLLQSPAQLPFSLAANQSRALSWSLTIPETAEGQLPLEAVTYKVVAKAGLSVVSEQLSGKQKRQRRKNGLTTTNQQPITIEDGEQNTLPMLPNRLLVTESLPLPIVGPATREFELQKLTSTTSATRRNYSLTLEMTPNPAWYAVQALPYLMEYPYECSEQVFSRLYANLLAAKILTSNPALKTTLAEWQRAARAGDKVALSSKLEQNQELKNLLLQETPWVRDAQNETERMRRLAELFDEPRLKAETARALAKLRQQQLPDGAFPWFEKMPADRYITQLIVAGFGKLQRLGAFDAMKDEQARPLLQSALAYLDGELQQDYARLRKQPKVDLKADNLNDVQIQGLYARSFWPAPAVPKVAQAAHSYYQQQAATYWPGRTRYLQAQTALALHRAKSQSAAASLIMTALSENALHSSELGIYWKDVRGGYYWREAPTETQATLIEAFDEVANDQRAVDEMKLWLLKQKQVQNWPSTRATADACYALLLRGSDWLKLAAEPLTVTVGGQPAQPTSQQAGTGYYKITWPAAEIKPAQGRVTVRKPDAGVAWGALYWQYFEQLDKITPAATGLSLERQLYREQRTAAGPVLEPLTPATPLRVGDVLVVRLVLRADRDLEYVHLKDQRAAGLELIGQTSGYRYQGGLGYYESPRDAATNFFISYFPKGTHTFEYRLRAAQAGNFSGGLSQLQCLYAPEFTTHSAGTRVSIAEQR
ncbi:alpha-2-macroglobulin family protein [Hymenobacter psychrophilus]|uniref:Uncharacterized conserved protein YfaS, alpha-2-macroglobulin family n=1 Tax=Hymenobacter psychrophilus TaxID=651662 RepID=A0A1H3M896_9BACT|nr:MG2 domain-containing protein [Hymenobacter psychrophilus]SDY72235.1 Uncharacterized conserved protein YfaS, alpha-2-macroglobulin family [Hymenobacter psychrophilus]